MAARPPRRAPFGALLGANMISLIGNQLTIVAIPWFVLQTSGSPARAGQVGALGAVAAIGAALSGGLLIDRVGARRASIATDLASTLAVAAIPLLDATRGLAFWQLLLLASLRTLLNTPGGAARQSLLPDLIALAGFRPERGNAAYQGVQNLAQLAGPALAGLLIAALGTGNVLWLDAATFAVSASLIATLVPRTTPAPTVHPSNPPPTPRTLHEGFRFLAGNRLVLALIVTAMVGNGLNAALFGVILPVLVRAWYGSAVDLGFLLAAWGGGTTLGALAYGIVGLRLPRRALLIAGSVVLGLPFWLFVAVPVLPFPSAIAALTVMGLSAGLVNPLAFTLLQEQIPAALRGRVFGIFFALGGVVTPIALLGAGYLLERAGLTAALIVTALGFLALVAWLLLNPAYRNLSPAPQQKGQPPG